MSTSDDLIDRDRPAVLGGPAVRSQGPPAWPLPNDEVVAALHRAAGEGAWGRYIGPYCDELRQVLRQVHGVEHVWLCSSGTAAVEFALRGLGVGPGDEVILAAYDFKANFVNVLALGALPVLVDLRPDDWQLNVDQVSAAITPKTKAVIASHLHGGSVAVADLRKVLGDRPIGIVEDACQCPGSILEGRRAGSLGDTGVMSFGGSKLTAAGRGGAIVTSNSLVIERVKRHAMRGNDLSPLSELQAAALIPQWRQIDVQNDRRAASVHAIHDELKDVPGLRMLAPPGSPKAAGYYKVGFEYDPSAFLGMSRDLFCHAMRLEGIAMFAGFQGLHRIHASRRFRTAGPLPVTDLADERMIVLHHPVLLGNRQDISEIALAVRKILRAAPEIMEKKMACPPAGERDE